MPVFPLVWTGGFQPILPEDRPAPEIRVLSSQKEEVEHVGQWVSGRAKDSVAPHEFGVFVRSAAELDRARVAVQFSGLPFKILDENVETTSGHVSISTMHLTKGLEFRGSHRFSFAMSVQRL